MKCMPPPNAFIIAVFITALWSLHSHAQGGNFRVQSEAQVSLSLAQEADEAIDRAQRWLREQPPVTNDLSRILLRRYALSSPGETFRLSKCDLTPLEHAMPAELAPEAMTNLTSAISLRREDPKALFALQRDLPSANPPPDWRERLVTHFVNAQRIDARGGHWGDAEATVWAILSLRALLNESIPVTVE